MNREKNMESKDTGRAKGRAGDRSAGGKKNGAGDRSAGGRKNGAGDQNRKAGKCRSAGAGREGIKPQKSPCPVFKKCGGCQLLLEPYKKQIERKQEQLRKLLKPYCKTQAFIPMEDPRYYRHKVTAAFDRDRKGNVISGVFQEGTHIVVPVESCLLENQKADAIMATIRGLLKSFKIKTYDEDSGYGLLRYVQIRTAYATGQVMVVLVLSSPILPSKNNFVKALRGEHPEIATVVVNVNDKKTSMVLGEKQQVIYGPGYIEDELCGLRFKISPGSFYQVNPSQTEKLYGKAMEYACLTGKETVLDAYCGTGTIGMIAAKRAGKVIGVELGQAAVRDAVAGARNNGITNIRFYQKDAGEFMVQLAQSGDPVDVVFMDPPRGGSDERFLDSLTRLRPKRVVYISCNPETLVRDLKYLCGRGWKVEKAVGVDMFPFTVNVETVVLLSQLKPDDYIDVELDLDELDVTAAEQAATYQEIKDYIMEKHGVKVHTAYIAQVKKKYGLDMRKNYHQPQNEKYVAKQCTAEKEKYIKEALEHFVMIS